MKNELNDIKIREALATITVSGNASGADTDIVTSGAVSGIVIKDGHVGFSIEIDPKDKDTAEPLKRAAEKAVLALDGVLSATALLTAHQPASSPQASPKDAQQGDQGTLQPATHVIAVASGKGGVGKSTTAINLALALADTGKKVGILDADIYGPSLPRLIGNNRKPESDGKKIKPIEVWGLQTMSIGFLVDEETPTIWRGPMVMSALEQMLRDVSWDGLDILVIDMPPGTGDAQLSLSQRATLAGAVIVSTPQDLALIDARKGLNMFKKVNVPLLGIVENMSFFSCPDCGSRHNIFGNGGAEAEAKKLGVPFLGDVPLEMDIRETSDAGKPIVVSAPDSPHAAHYHKIAAGVLDALNIGKAAAPNIVFE